MPRPISHRAALCFAALVLLSPLPGNATEAVTPTAARTTVTAVIPPDSPPTYYRDEQTGKPAGFAVDVMDAVADRAGLRVNYRFEDGWEDIIKLVEDGAADLAPGMGVSREREKDLAFSEPIDAFPISFFVRSEHPGIEASPGVHSVGVIRGSVAFEKLKDRGDLRLVTYEGFAEGLFDLLAGKIEAFACPAPTLRQLARKTGVEARIKVVDRPIAEITRAVAVRKNDAALLDRLNKAIAAYVGTPAYQHVYAKWYGKPAVYWTPRRIIVNGSLFTFLIVVVMGGWRYRSVLRLNRELTAAMADRDRARDDRKESEDRYRKIFESVQDVIYQTDAAGNFIDISPSVTAYSGYSREELLGKPAASFYADPADRAKLLQILQATGKVSDHEIVMRAKDGRRVHASLSAQMLFDATGAPAGVEGILRDITERKMALAAGRINQERLESLVRISQLRVETIQEMLDFALEEAIRLTASRIGYIYFYNEEKREFTLNTWSREVMQECAVTEPQTVYQLERTGIWGEAVRQRRPIVVQDYREPNPLKKGCPAGHVRLDSFLTVPVLSEDRIVAVVGVANKEEAYDQNDINQLTLLMDAVWKIVEHKRIEAALRENEAVLRSFLNAVTESALLVDRKGRILAANETFAGRFGKNAPEITGNSVFDLLPPEVSAGRKAHFDTVFATGWPERFEDRREGRVIDNSVYPVFDTKGGVTALAIIGMDVTERRAAEWEREKLIAELQKALAEIKTLHGILPICSSCKKIRDDQGAWHSLEAYIRDHTEAEFTHGLCLECAKKLYPEYVPKDPSVGNADNA